MVDSGASSGSGYTCGLCLQFKRFAAELQACRLPSVLLAAAVFLTSSSWPPDVSHGEHLGCRCSRPNEAWGRVLLCAFLACSFFVRFEGVRHDDFDLCPAERDAVHVSVFNEGRFPHSYFRPSRAYGVDDSGVIRDSWGFRPSRPVTYFYPTREACKGDGVRFGVRGHAASFRRSIARVCSSAPAQVVPHAPQVASAPVAVMAVFRTYSSSTQVQA